MGQKTNPISNRLGYIRGWDSNWYGGNKYSDKLLEDYRLRAYLKVKLANASVSRIVIERFKACDNHYLHSSPWFRYR